MCQLTGGNSFTVTAYAYQSMIRNGNVTPEFSLFFSQSWWHKSTIGTGNSSAKYRACGPRMFDRIKNDFRRY